MSRPKSPWQELAPPARLDPEAEGSLAQLQVEEPAVGEAQGGAGGLGQVGGQHGHGAVPPPGAAAELADVVEVRSCGQDRRRLRAKTGAGPGAGTHSPVSRSPTT